MGWGIGAITGVRIGTNRAEAGPTAVIKRYRGSRSRGARRAAGQGGCCTGERKTKWGAPGGGCPRMYRGAPSRGGMGVGHMFKRDGAGGREGWPAGSGAASRAGPAGASKWTQGTENVGGIRAWGCRGWSGRQSSRAAGEGAGCCFDGQRRPKQAGRNRKNNKKGSGEPAVGAGAVLQAVRGWGAGWDGGAGRGECAQSRGCREALRSGGPHKGKGGLLLQQPEK